MFSTLKKIVNRIKVLPFYCLPQHRLTALIYKLARIENKFFKNNLIKLFIALFNIDMTEAILKNAEDYRCFNDFFTRRLKQNARNWKKDKHLIVSPVDGRISQMGRLNKNKLIQAKGLDYSLERLLANDEGTIKHFQDGSFTTLYLSPKDYHRIHMPISGTLIKTIYVPGDLFSVNNASVQTVDKLFARNERFISIFKTIQGLMAQIMVGAIFVGSMETVFTGLITPRKKRKIEVKQYEEENVVLKQSEEFGHFNMGSTVILLFEQDKISWKSELGENDPIQVGQTIAKINEVKKQPH